MGGEAGQTATLEKVLRAVGASGEKADCPGGLKKEEDGFPCTTWLKVSAKAFTEGKRCSGCLARAIASTALSEEAMTGGKVGIGGTLLVRC